MDLDNKIKERFNKRFPGSIGADLDSYSAGYKDAISTIHSLIKYYINSSTYTETALSKINNMITDLDSGVY